MILTKFIVKDDANLQIFIQHTGILVLNIKRYLVNIITFVLSGVKFNHLWNFDMNVPIND